jgi:hypothetical protein
MDPLSNYQRNTIAVTAERLPAEQRAAYYERLAARLNCARHYSDMEVVQIARSAAGAVLREFLRAGGDTKKQSLPISDHGRAEKQN